jgi:hypothetical protein
MTQELSKEALRVGPLGSFGVVDFTPTVPSGARVPCGFVPVAPLGELTSVLRSPRVEGVFVPRMTCQHFRSCIRNKRSPSILQRIYDRPQ